ncbi:MAG: hypothetical protein B7Z05_07065 [Thiotrichales bacterium 32-46-8]|nr:DUF502 domain-containing protein [Gammaproteobacteria bacterium]OYX05249.1 MAG: hypothetical protein B7Z05_07065 [Thiotrichales bacterium 32-46-8]OYY25451.1 MAG: hypothetical protein B7Y68_00550 [Thiotrichales bacterium 35-46-9]OYZ04828.1 MAG: hypothetical protein B7Y29_06690 [Thiotrichales bacterium 16-46-22]OZA17783.1 MAG: hypothetical protein B7X85_04635 [Thiotrichales bacterium 17-46-47]OZA95802.1 MAG: hypothetical protein B7X52_06525 [Thiotrichales bacterium 34-46-19]OZB86968.1 MAG: h
MRKYLMAGLLVWLPLGVTVLVINFLIETFDQVLILLPSAYRPDELLGYHIPGFGLLMTAVVILVTGMIVANYLGEKLVGFWEGLLSRIPLVRSIYSAVKQVTEAFVGSEQSFQKAYLVEYPRRGTWTLAFQTSTKTGEAQIKTGLNSVVNVFVPTTPNPTSGFFLMVSQDDLVPLDMSVEQALKMIISGGVVVPELQESATEKDKLVKEEIK